MYQVQPVTYVSGLDPPKTCRVNGVEPTTGRANEAVYLRRGRTMRGMCFAALAVVTLSSSTNAQVVFSDSFDSENGGNGILNYSGFGNWSVSNGTVDLIGNGFNDFYPGNGLYVDLDGDTFNAGTLTSIPIDLVPGLYELSFELGENPNGQPNNTMLLSVGGVFSETITSSDAGTAPVFDLLSRTFEVSSPGAHSIVFDHAGGDIYGLIIDDVTLTLVPEPGSLLLLLVGAAAIGRSRR